MRTRQQMGKREWARHGTARQDEDEMTYPVHKEHGEQQRDTTGSKTQRDGLDGIGTTGETVFVQAVPGAFPSIFDVK